MTVTKRQRGYQATVSHKGERYRRQFATEHEAKVWEAETATHLLKGEAPVLGATAVVNDGKPYTLGALYDRVWERHWSHQRSAKTHAINAQHVVRILGRDMPVKSINYMAVSRLVSKLKAVTTNTDATINRKLTALSRMLTEAVECEVIDRKPKIELFKEDRGRAFRMTVQLEAQALEFFGRTGNAAMWQYLVLSIDTGMRQGESLKLTWRGVDARYVHLDGKDCKSGKPRSIPLTNRCKDTFRPRPGSGMVFPTLTKDGIRHHWAKMAMHLGLSEEPCFVPHIMRHEFCSRLADRGVAAQFIQAAAGHSSLIVTQRYINLSPVALEAAMNSYSGSAVAGTATEPRHQPKSSGFMALLTPEQRENALQYQGPDHFGQ